MSSGLERSKALPLEEVANFTAWRAAVPSELVLTEGIITLMEEGLP